MCVRERVCVCVSERECVCERGCVAVLRKEFLCLTVFALHYVILLLFSQVDRLQKADAARAEEQSDQPPPSMMCEYINLCLILESPPVVFRTECRYAPLGLYSSFTSLSLSLSHTHIPTADMPLMITAGPGIGVVPPPAGMVPPGMMPPGAGVPYGQQQPGFYGQY